MAQVKNGKDRPSKKKTDRWRLKRTLKRNTSFRPIEAEDMRFVYAAYKKGMLASMGPHFADGMMNAQEFHDAFGKEVVQNYAGVWTLFAETVRGNVPVGLVLGFWSHPDPEMSPFMIVGDMIWFPTASNRNRVEAAVRFFSEIRKQFPMMEYAKLEDKKFFEVLSAHGVMRRIGTSHSVYPKEVAAVFETRKGD